MTQQGTKPKQQAQVPTDEAKKRIRKWFFDPQTPEYAWKELSWREIAEQCRVSLTQAHWHLPPLVQQKYSAKLQEIEMARYLASRVQRKQGVKLSDVEVERIKEARKTGTIEEVAEEFGLSISTVQRYTGKKRKKNSDTEK